MSSSVITVELLDHMGSDKAICNAARVSFDKDREGGWGSSDLPLPLETKDARLIRYLADHGHWTPFAHAMVTVRVTAPIAVRTQCFKHKIGLTENEVSRRYVATPPEVYYPPTWRGRPHGNIKQGSGDPVPMQRESAWEYDKSVGNALLAYDRLIDMGVCPEQARLVLPQGMMTKWIWTGSLPAFARFYRLRTSPDAQAETRAVAVQVGAIIEPLFPAAWRALVS